MAVDDLRRHKVRCSSNHIQNGFGLLCEAEVHNPNVLICIVHYIFWFDVSVNDVHGVAMLKGPQTFLNRFSRHFLGVRFALLFKTFNAIKQLAS